ncbi:Rho GTPase activator [Apiospora arundinis]
MTIGVEWLTGSVEIQTFDHATTDNKVQSSEDDYAWCRFRVRFPRWLSEKALDSFLYQESQSWKHILTPYSVRKMDSALGHRLSDIADEDDLGELVRLLQSGEIALGDHFIKVHNHATTQSGKRIENGTASEASLFSEVKVGKYAITWRRRVFHQL